jgi:uncharacterized membrane protein YphA (DoxX/SURF4 family)
MNLAYTTLTVVLAIVSLAFGLAKVLRLPRMRELARHVNFSINSYAVIGALEIAAAAGLLLGFVYRPFAAAAATGLCMLMVGAIIVLVRTGGKLKDCTPAFVLGVLSAVTIWLAVVS